MLVIGCANSWNGNAVGKSRITFEKNQCYVQAIIYPLTSFYLWVDPLFNEGTTLIWSSFFACLWLCIKIMLPICCFLLFFFCYPFCHFTSQTSEFLHLSPLQNLEKEVKCCVFILGHYLYMGIVLCLPPPHTHNFKSFSAPPPFLQLLPHLFFFSFLFYLWDC